MTEQFDLSQFDTRVVGEQGAVMEVLHPVTGVPITEDDGTPWTITLLGADSETYTKNMYRAADKRIKESLKAGGFRNPVVSRISSEAIDSDDLESLALATKAWKIRLDGRWVGDSMEERRSIYGRFKWLREQAAAFLNDRSNYLGERLSSSTNSPEEHSSMSSPPQAEAQKEPT